MEILDVDLLAFENGDAAARGAVVDGVMKSLVTGFVYVEHDLSVDMLDEVYGRLEAFFTLPQERKDAYHVPGAHGQIGYTGLLVETAATAEVPDWKEMLNWGAVLDEEHPLRMRFPHRYRPPLLPDADIAGIEDLLFGFHDAIADLQARVLRIIAIRKALSGSELIGILSGVFSVASLMLIFYYDVRLALLGVALYVVGYAGVLFHP